MIPRKSDEYISLCDQKRLSTLVTILITGKRYIHKSGGLVHIICIRNKAENGQSSLASSRGACMLP